MSEPKAKPIIFTGPEVRATLDGRKTQTRRPMKPQPVRQDVYPKHLPDGRWNWCLSGTGIGGPPFKAPYQPGDLLWVRETWLPESIAWHDATIAYQADGEELDATTARAVHIDDDTDVKLAWKYFHQDRWITPIHMPRWASRITLRVMDVRVERVQEISEEDARAEGIADGGCLNCGNSEPCKCLNPSPSAREAFIFLWNSIHSPDAWERNDWVWVIEFEWVNQAAATA